MVTCARIREEPLAEKYVLGELSEADREAFEGHYFECADCCEDLQTYPSLLEELQRRAASIQAERSRTAALPRWAWAAAATVAVTVALSLGIWLRRPVVEAHPESVSSPVPSLEELVRVEPPPYKPVTVRGAIDEASQRFREAMQHYVEGDYVTAIEGLQAAARLKPGAPDISFFLGICYLLTGQTDPALEHLHETVAFGNSPYLEEAHFYLAKAHLRTGDLDAAEEELRTTVQLRGEMESEAQELLGRLETLGESSSGREGPVPDGAERP